MIHCILSFDALRLIIAGNDVNIFLSSVFNGEYYIEANGNIYKLPNEGRVQIKLSTKKWAPAHLGGAGGPRK